MATPSSTPSRHVLILDHPRSCSNLLGKLLDTHPNINRLHRPWRDCRTRGPDKPILSITPGTVGRFTKRREEAAERGDDSGKDFTQETLTRANDRVDQAITTAEADRKLAIFQEHTAVMCSDEVVQGYLRDPDYIWSPQQGEDPNPTILRPNIIQNSIPFFLIRHPALAIPSFLRMHTLLDMLVPEDEMFRYWISMKWQRVVYDYFRSLGRKPVVIDAYDLVHNTTAVLAKLCESFRIEAGLMKEEWKVGEGVGMQEADVEREWLKMLRESTGVVRGEGTADEEIKVEELVGEWERQFGKERSVLLKTIVEAEMVDYEYLWKRRMQV